MWFRKFWMKRTFFIYKSKKNKPKDCCGILFTSPMRDCNHTLIPVMATNSIFAFWGANWWPVIKRWPNSLQFPEGTPLSWSQADVIFELTGSPFSALNLTTHVAKATKEKQERIHVSLCLVQRNRQMRKKYPEEYCVSDYTWLTHPA